MPELKKIPIDDLKVGMVIIRSDKPGIIFDEYGIPITSENKITMLKNNGVSYVFVWDKNDEKATTKEVVKPRIKPKENITVKDKNINAINLTKSLDIPKAKSEVSINNFELSIPVKKIDISTEHMIIANSLLEKSKSVILSSFSSIKKGERINISELSYIFTELVEATLLYPGIFTNVARLESMGEAEYTHGLNVAILSLSIGQAMELNGNSLVKLGIAGLLHDVGKSRIPDKLLQKNSRLTDQEFNVLSKHPEWGEQILFKSTDISQDILSIVLHHHERTDGSGYPSQLTSKYLSKLDIIVGLAEDYDTMIGGGSESYPILHSCEAVKRIYNGLGSKFPEEYVKAFLKTIGIFPIGSFVRLTNNSTAIVAELNKNNPLQPKVISVNVDTSHITSFIDLKDTDTKIEAPISAYEYNIDTKSILDSFVKISIEQMSE